MAATVFPAPSSASLPPMAAEKIFESYSVDGFMSYRPTGGLPAGRYAIEARGVDVDFIEVAAPGFGGQGRGNFAYFDVVAGGSEIQATACTYRDPSFLTTAKTFAFPSFIFANDELGTYSWNPGNTVAYDSTTGNWVAFGGNSTNMRVACSPNGASWTLFGDSLASQGWTHLGDTQTRGIIADTTYAKGVLYAQSYHPDGGNLYRTSDLTGRSGWSATLSGGGFNIFGSPNPASNRVFRTIQGQIQYTDNGGFSWTTVNVGTGVDTGNGLYSPAFKGNDIYIISSGRYYSGTQTSKIFKSTNDGGSWTEVHNFGTDLVPTSLAYSPTLNRFAVTVYQSASGNGIRVRYSDDDCVNWTYGVGFPGNPADTTAQRNNAIIWHNDRFVAAYSDGSNGPVLLGTSPDAATAFTTVRNPVGTIITTLLSTSVGVVYRTTATTQGILRTSDFTNFSEPSTAFTNANGVAYANGNYVVTNGTANYLYGPNLENLELRTTPVSALNFVVAGNGVFMATDASSRYVTSSDGITWTLGPASSLHSGWKPSFQGGYFFAQNGSNVVMSSIDGITWTTIFSPGTSYAKITKVKDLFVLHGPGTSGSYSYTRDLVNWDTITGTNANFRSIGYHEDGFYVLQPTNQTNYECFAGIDRVSSGSLGGVQLGRTTSNETIQTSNTGRVENVAGVTLVRRGYVRFGESFTTTYSDSPRMYLTAGTPSSNVVLPDTLNTNNEQISRSNGQLVIANTSSTIRIKYGKPAAFAVYRLKS